MKEQCRADRGRDRPDVVCIWMLRNMLWRSDSGAGWRLDGWIAIFLRRVRMLQVVLGRAACIDLATNTTTIEVYTRPHDSGTTPFCFRVQSPFSAGCVLLTHPGCLPRAHTAVCNCPYKAHEAAVMVVVCRAHQGHYRTIVALYARSPVRS